MTNTYIGMRAMSKEISIRSRETKDGGYVIVGGGTKDEWIRMDWRADVPKNKRRHNSLLVEVKE